MKNNIYRDGKVHVLASMCETCIFRPDSEIDRRRVAQMIRLATKHESSIICHDTLGTSEHAACHGFFKLHPTPPLQVADRLGYLTAFRPSFA